MPPTKTVVTAAAGAPAAPESPGAKESWIEARAGVVCGPESDSEFETDADSESPRCGEDSVGGAWHNVSGAVAQAT